MSNSSNDVKPSKPAFSYARAAKGSNAPTPTAGSPQLNGKSAATNETDVNTNASGPVTTNEKISDALPGASSENSSRSNVSSASAAQPAWKNKGTGVHMPPRTSSGNSNATPSVQFGNFGNTPNSPAQNSPAVTKVTPTASGGTAPPPALQGKDVPQFGSIPSATGVVDSTTQSHSRSNSTTSDFRPTMSPNPQFPMGYQAGPHAQFSPAMPNYRGRGGAIHQFQNRGGARNVQGSRNANQSPMNSPQPQHAMASPMNSPGMYNPGYMQAQGMYPTYGGYQQPYGYNQGQNFQPQHMGQMYMNPQGGRNQSSYNQQHQYQNPNLQAPTATSMSRSGSAASERPPSTMTPGAPSSSTPVPSSATSAFTTPRKKGSSAIRIVDPNSKTEVVLPKATAPTEPKREVSASPAPKIIDRAVSTGSPRPTSSTAQAVPETSEQRKAKQDAAKQAILDRIAASKAAEQLVNDNQAKEQQIAREADAAAAAKAKAEEEAKEAEEKARLAAEASRVEEEKAAEARVLEAKMAADKAQQEEKEQEERRERDEEARLLAEAEKARSAAEAEEKAKAEAAIAAEKANTETEASNESSAEEVSDETASVPKEPTTAKVDDSGTLDTIVEPISAGQKEDVIETKGLDSASDVDATETNKVSSSKKRGASGSADSSTPEKELPSAMTTALKTSRRIAQITSVLYPTGINAPSKEINKNSKDGKIRYDKEFLLQFQKVFVDKPTFDWDETIKSAMRDPDAKSGKGAMGARSASNRAGSSPFGGLPAFNSKPLKSSDERFQQSEKMRAAGIDPGTALAGAPSFERGGAFKPSMSRKDSLNNNSPRTESKRGGKGGRTTSNRPEKAQIGAPTIAPEDVKPLANSGNRWTPKRAAEAEPLPGGDITTMAPEIVQRKVKGLLNKLTLDNFDRITDQILEIASQSKDETDGRTLRQVIALTFEKATDEAHFSNMYARFCRKMMECTSEEVKDEGITDKHGKQVVGGALFRKYLLSRCQEDFERGWKTELPPKPDGEPQSEEAAMLSDEYYIAAAAKRRGLGLVRFIGELFLLQMLNEKIMQECIRKLLANVVDPEEEEVESLSKLVETVGSALDSTERGRHVMNVYMERMQQLTSCDSLSSRIKFMVLDVLDLRKAGWVGSKTDKGPKTIQQIHDEAAQAAALKESQRGPSHRGGMGGMGGGGGRPDFGRGDARNVSRRQESHGPSVSTGADGWSTLKGAAARDTRAGDLTKFGKFGDKRTTSQQSTFGPGGNLSQTTRTNSNQVSRNPSHSAQSREDSRISQAPSNPFAALEGDNGEPVEVNEQPSEDASKGRPRLNLLPKGTTDGTEAVNEKPEEDEPDTVQEETQAADEADSIPMPGDE